MAGMKKMDNPCRAIADPGLLPARPDGGREMWAAAALSDAVTALTGAINSPERRRTDDPAAVKVPPRACD